MIEIGWITRQPQQNSTRTMVQRMSGCVGVALLLAASGHAYGQVPQAPQVGSEGTNGYVVHHSADLGGHIANISGSGRMYDTLVNIQSGPRVLGQTFTAHPLETLQHPVFDSLTAFTSGFGGDPNNMAKLDFSKAKIYEFSGLFRRDRQYFDYNLLGNVNTFGLSVPYSVTNGVASSSKLQWQPQQQFDSPQLYNTVRRMTSTDLTVLPLSKVSFRFGYSGGIFQGPSLISNRAIGKYDNILNQYQRNSTDDFTAAIDWKPVEHTKLTFEEQIEHYKADTYMTLPASSMNVQLADGTPASLGNWDALASPYTISACNTASMGSAYTNSSNYTILSAPQTPGGKPILNPACAAVTSYLRTQPTRIFYPTELFRLQSTSIKNVAMNGDLRYSVSNMNLPNYYENWQGLSGLTRSATITGSGKAQRRVVGVDYGIVWNLTKTITLSDQLDFSNVHQPSSFNGAASVTQNTPTNPNGTVNYSGQLVTGTGFTVDHYTGAAESLNGYFGQKFLTNNATIAWDASTRATFSLTYQHRLQNIFFLDVVDGENTTTDINEDAGIFNAALRPTSKWDVNGTVEFGYFDNAYTPVAPRQLKHYRLHTIYRPKAWATLSGAFNDLERHNNTNNTGTASADGPLQHVDYSRIGSLGLSLAPNEKYGVDFNYSYSDVYTSTNICYLSGASAALPGAAALTPSGAPAICPTMNAVQGPGGLTTEWGPVKDFMDAPTQYVSAALSLTPNPKFHTDLGYRISAVGGNQFFNDAQEVNGALNSKYQSPFVHVAWTVHPGWVWKAQYDYFGYGEGGPSGATLCSTTSSTSAAVVPCTNFPGMTAITMPAAGFTTPRTFHANNVTLAMHYEF